MVSRLLEGPLRELMGRYPTVTLTGPRQSGKTTACRQAFPDLPYANLEAGDVRDFALRDPRGFLGNYPDGAILDEVQRAPELLSYVQVLVDEERKNGRFLLTGSSQLELDSRISQSLAGRTAMIELLPLSIAEARRFGVTPSTNEWIYSGFYPRLYDQGIEPTRALGDYVETYVERDVRQLLQVRDLVTFRRFLGICAGRTGGILNASNLANDVGISHVTVREWLSVLEASYVRFRLPPHFANVGKRLVESPKLYFYDVGLAAYLCGIEDARQIATHPLRGVFFENLCIVEAIKQRTHRGQRARFFFYRDSSDTELDLLAQHGGGWVAIEIKSAATLNGRFFDSLGRADALLGEPVHERILVYDGEPLPRREGARIVRPEGLAEVLGSLDAPPAEKALWATLECSSHAMWVSGAMGRCIDRLPVFSFSRRSSPPICPEDPAGRASLAAGSSGGVTELAEERAVRANGELCYRADLPNKSKDQVCADYARFGPICFGRNDNSAWRERLEAFLR